MRRLTFPDSQQNSAQRKHNIASECDREIKLTCGKEVQLYVDLTVLREEVIL